MKLLCLLQEDCSGGLGDYATIHVTPEAAFSYVSFETNRLVENYMELIENVINTFKPGKLMVTFYATRVGHYFFNNNQPLLSRHLLQSTFMKIWRTATKSASFAETTFSSAASRFDYFLLCCSFLKYFRSGLRHDLRALLQTNLLRILAPWVYQPWGPTFQFWFLLYYSFLSIQLPFFFYLNSISFNPCYLSWVLIVKCSTKGLYYLNFKVVSTF